MRQGKLEDRLQMRRLTVDDTAQYNALLRYAFQVTDSELASLGWNQKEMERSKKPVLKKTESFGWFDGEKLASQISVYPMQVATPVTPPILYIVPNRLTCIGYRLI